MRSQHMAFTERNAVLKKIHKEAVRLIFSADAALAIIVLVVIHQMSCYCFHSHVLSPPERLLPSNDLCRRVVGCVCFGCGLPKPVGTDSFVSLEGVFSFLLVSCLGR